MLLNTEPVQIGSRCHRDLLLSAESPGWPLPAPQIARPRASGPGQTKTVHVAFPASALAVTPGDIDGSVPPQVELGAYQVQIGTPASLTADFTIHS